MSADGCKTLLEVDRLAVEFRTRSTAPCGTVRWRTSSCTPKGEIVGLVGESGSGKSVLSYALLGISDRRRASPGSQRFRRHRPACGRRGDALAICAGARSQ
jgi:peptide/nickel transport system ATP-binding protein